MGRLLFCIFLLHPAISYPQAASTIPGHVVYLVGNTADASDSANLIFLRSILEKEVSPATLIYNGDILHRQGVTKPISSEDSSFIRFLIGIAGDLPGVRTLFVPGDQDWDNSGKKGWQDVRELEDLVNHIAGDKIFLPESGCPGPFTIEGGNNLNIVLINSQWWIHPYDHPVAPSTDCKVIVEGQFIEELEDEIEDAEGKNVLIVGHHPAVSIGEYGGRVTLADHFTPPIIGSFEAAFHQNIGNPRDISYPAYREFAEKMKYLLQDYSPIVYASAHDYNLQALQLGNSYQIVSGSIVKNKGAGSSKNTVYRSQNPGFIKLTYYDNGRVTMKSYEIEKRGNQVKSYELYQSICDPDNTNAPVNTQFTPCLEKIVPAENMNPVFRDSTGTAIAGPEYKASFLKKAFLGSLYRSSWTAPVQVSYLDLDTTRLGLNATGKGGGRQTKSLSFKGGDGRSYVFRSVNKDPVKALDPILRKTFIVGLSRQITATQNPYGALPVAFLLDKTSIFHVNPSLYLLPNDPKLGMFQKEYGNMLGMLEEKPDKGKGAKAGTFGSDDIVRSYDLFRKLYKDHDNRVDAVSFARARVFDIWIGDWGRHEDNWKWAGYKVDNRTTYFPIPRDRDHAFSRWNGLLLYLGSRHWALPNAENFNYKFHDISSLTWAARHLDRFLLSPLDRDDWMVLAEELRGTMNNAVIDSAIRQFPPGVIPLSGNIIGAKLKSRREDLNEGVSEFYKLLAKQVDVVGSNKAEYFTIKRLEKGDVEVSMFDKDKKTGASSGPALFHRIFRFGETRNVNVYCLDGNDVVVLEGSVSKTIMVRIFGGKGNDTIVNRSMVSSMKQYTRVYEYEDEKNNSVVDESDDLKTVLSNDNTLIEYNRQAFHYHTYLPLPVIIYSPDDGLSFDFGTLATFHGFGKDGYADKFNVSAGVSTQGTIQFRFHNEVHHAIRKWDWVVNGEIAEPHPYVYFFGLGNESVFIDSLGKAYYRSRFSGFNLSTGLQKVFWIKSSFYTHLFYQNNEGQIPEDNFLSDQNIVPGEEKTNFMGAEASLDIDFRDNPFVPKRGIRLFARESYAYITNLNTDFYNSEISLEFYQTSRTLIPLTLGIKGGFAHAGGHVPFYELNTLGRTTHLRGYLRDRFTGNTAAYLQNQLSVEFGSVKTFLAPLTIGIFGFYDLGRVWVPGETSTTIHSGYGGGVYFIPLFEFLTTRISMAFSDEEKSGLLEVGLGLKL